MAFRDRSVSTAVSYAGARGLLQLMPETATRLARSVELATFEHGKQHILAFRNRELKEYI